MLNYQSEKKYTLAEDEFMHLNAFIDSKNYIIDNNYAIQQSGNNTRSHFSFGINSLAAHVWMNKRLKAVNFCKQFADLV
jgi:hypothetical protein